MPSLARKVGREPDRSPGSPDAGLWGQFPSIAGSAPSHIVLRPNTDEGQRTSSRLYAANKALLAC